MKTSASSFTYLIVLLLAGLLSGCAHYERNTGKGTVPGFFIRSEMQDADRALDNARGAGKDKLCPAEFQEAERARNEAYDVYRACHTEEGAALARKAAAKANALCPPVSGEAQATPEAEAPLGPVPVTEPAPGGMKYCVDLGIEFDIGKAEVRPQYHEEVAKVGNFMKKYPTTTAVIDGYTDEVGSDEYNLKLSRERAANVAHYLEQNFGIATERLSTVGHGKAQPVATNANETGKQKNRRITATIDCALNVQQVEIPPDKLCMSLKLEYPTGSAAIDPRYRDELAGVADYLKKFPTTTAVIEGHTDNVGGYDYNMKLSLQRAQGVVNYLVENYGIERSRLAAKGYGYTRRVAYNTTPEGRQKNRRINAVIDCVLP